MCPRYSLQGGVIRCGNTVNILSNLMNKGNMVNQTGVFGHYRGLTRGTRNPSKTFIQTIKNCNFKNTSENT